MSISAWTLSLFDSVRQKQLPKSRCEYWYTLFWYLVLSFYLVFPKLELNNFHNNIGSWIVVTDIFVKSSLTYLNRWMAETCFPFTDTLTNSYKCLDTYCWVFVFSWCRNCAESIVISGVRGSHVYPIYLQSQLSTLILSNRSGRYWWLVLYIMSSELKNFLPSLWLQLPPQDHRLSWIQSRGFENCILSVEISHNLLILFESYSP